MLHTNLGYYGSRTEVDIVMGKKYRITILQTGQTFPCGEDEFILEAMKKARCGIITFGCFGGGCGACKMKVVFGEYYIEKKMSRAHVSLQEQESGIVLMCCVKPRSDMDIVRVN